MDHHLNFPAQRSSPIHTTAYLISHFGLFKNHLKYNFSLWNASASRLVLLITLVAPLLLGLRQKSSTGLRRMHRAPSLPSPASVHSLFSYPSRSPATWASINSWNKSFSLLPQSFGRRCSLCLEFSFLTFCLLNPLYSKKNNHYLPSVSDGPF